MLCYSKLLSGFSFEDNFFNKPYDNVKPFRLLAVKFVLIRNTLVNIIHGC